MALREAQLPVEGEPSLPSSRRELPLGEAQEEPIASRARGFALLTRRARKALFGLTDFPALAWLSELEGPLEARLALS